MQKNESIFVAGHRGLAGGAIARELAAGGFTNLLPRNRPELDLLDRPRDRGFVAWGRPRVACLAADVGVVGTGGTGGEVGGAGGAGAGADGADDVRVVLVDWLPTPPTDRQVR